jgi:hypothetical protein
LFPVPTIVPTPQPLSYHFQIAPTDNEPVLESVDDCPDPISDGLADTVKGSIGVNVTVIVVLKQVVELQIPSALTKYVVVTVGLRTRAAPEFAYVTPHEPEYQTQIAEVPKVPPEILRFELVPEQIEEGLAAKEVGPTDKVFKVIVVFTQRVVLHVP